MNKQQKRKLVRTRRFNQKMNVIFQKLANVTVDVETGGIIVDSLSTYTAKANISVNKDLVTKLTMKELEHLLKESTKEGYPEAIAEALNFEYAERQLLREKQGEYEPS